MNNPIFPPIPVFIVGKTAPKSKLADIPFEVPEVMQALPNKGDVIQMDGTDNSEPCSLFIVDGIVWKKGKDIQTDHFQPIESDSYYPTILVEFIR